MEVLVDFSGWGGGGGLEGRGGDGISVCVGGSYSDWSSGRVNVVSRDVLTEIG